MHFLFLFFIYCVQLYAALPQESGTLIVSYQTGPKEERLDRVRFRLWNDQQEEQFYPKSCAHTDSDNCQHRMVVIENLAVGKYSLQFLVPNADHLFDEIPERFIEMHKDEVLRINQFLRPRYASLKTPDQPQKNDFRPLSGNNKDNLLFFWAAAEIGSKLTDSQMLPPSKLHSAFNFVPGGRSILGNPFTEFSTNALPSTTIDVAAFSIATYEVTNSEYADFLNRAHQKQKIDFATAGKHKGIVFDRKGDLLCKTIEAEPLSQLRQVVDPNGTILFAPVDGKEDFPVIFVSWYGADLFCRAHGCYLPNEAEWEKAAAIDLHYPLSQFYKYRYGFSSDVIDRTWANYQTDFTTLPTNSVQTTKVGYYNGINKARGMLTHDAKSPCGAYDMSGNVWEWVSDWHGSSYLHISSLDYHSPLFGNSKVAKGGCYASFAEGVRVAERIALPPWHTDAYTGFRMAKK